MIKGYSQHKFKGKVLFGCCNVNVVRQLRYYAPLMLVFYLFIATELFQLIFKHIAIFIGAGACFYALFICIMFYKGSNRISRCETIFYVYPFLMILSIFWAKDPMTSLFYVCIGVFYMGIYFFICRLTLATRIRMTSELSLVLAFVGFFVGMYIYSKYGALRGFEVQSVGLKFVYASIISMPFLIMQLIHPFSPSSQRTYFSKGRSSICFGYNCFYRILSGFALLLIILLNILTLSRLGIVALFLIPLIYFFLYYGFSVKLLIYNTMWAGFLLGAITIFYFFSPEVLTSIWHRFLLGPDFVSLSHSNIKNFIQYTEIAPDFGRILMYVGTIQIIYHNPILGVGYGNAAKEMPQYLGMNFGKTVHNFVLGSMAEMGLFGLVLSISLLCFAFYRSFGTLKKSKRLQDNLRGYHAASFTSFFMIILVSMFQPVYQRWPFYFVFGIILARNK